MRWLAIFMFLLGGCATVPEPAPNVAYAWATFDRNGVTASGASGLADPGRGRAMTIDDPVGWAEKIQFDVWWQQQFLRSKHFNNQQFTGIPPDNGDFTQFGPDLQVTGTLTSFGVFATAKF